MAGESHWSGDPNNHKGKDAWDKLTGKGIYYVNPGSAPPPPPGPAPAPPPPPPPPPGQKQTSQVKVANVNVINTNYAATPVEQMEKMFFQDVGGTEILSVARHDTVGGEKVIYSEVDNLQDLKIQFNPLNILVSTNLNDLFSGYGIDIKEKVSAAGQTVQIDASGNMVIEVVGVSEDEYVQVQVASRVEDFEVGN